MKRYIIGFFLCVSASAFGAGAAGLSKTALSLVQNAVFEVLVEKAHDDPTVYERELDWDLVPYAIRTDKYYSIGTAFAVSKTELLTAFHVIDLGYDSIVYDKYFVRDSGGNVYEVDEIIAGSNERDFLRFTVKDRTFTDYFQFETRFKIGDPVYSIGNALGEGIVVRNGLVLGTIPEEESGRWNMLKSSADGNPGNSGGPLVTPKGKVVALVTSLRDNILYSVPASVILDTEKDNLHYRVKQKYGHLILSNSIPGVVESDTALPAHYKDVQKKIVAAGDIDYNNAMNALFADAPEYLTGENNTYLLNAVISTMFPQLDFVDSDGNWYLSNLNIKSYDLPDDGRLSHVTVSGFDFYKLTRPKSVPLAKAETDPRYIEDTILQVIRLDRTLWGKNKYRILSLGDVGKVSEYRDAQGRLWISAQWTTTFDDEILLMYILPLPNGPAIISTMQPSARIAVYDWDMKKTCDHVHAAYSATFTDWNDFIALEKGKFVPAFLANFRFTWQPDAKKISIAYPGISFSADSQVFDWTGESELFLAPAYFKIDGKIEFGLRKIIFNRDLRRKEYLNISKGIRPDPKLGSNVTENWNDMVAEIYPFDGKPAISVKDNTGSIGAVFKADNPHNDILYTLYLSMTNPKDEENLASRFAAVRDGLKITK